MLWVIGALVAVALVGGAAAFVLVNSDENNTASSAKAEPTEQTAIEKAAEECGVSANVGDSGTSIEFDTEGEEDYSGDDISDVACVLGALDTPDRVVSRMDSTRALDGTQDSSWGDYEAFWNYHPDSGMNLTVFIAE